MEETIQPQMGLTFERVWAAIQRIAEQTAEQHKELAEQHKETERAVKELAEQHKETERFLKESKEDADRQMKELRKSMGDLSNRFGEMAEHLVVPNIVQKFNALGYHFEDISGERKFFNPETGRIEAEFDIILENGSHSVGVEVKTKPQEKDIGEHIRRIEWLRGYKDKRGDKREIRGALAGAIMPGNVRAAALDAGLYVLEQAGDTMKIEEPRRVRAW
jgi:hypothetical protein